MPEKLDIKKFLQEWGPEGKPIPRADPEEAPGELVKITLKEGDSISVPSDMMARPQTTRFEEDLSLYANASDIIRVHRERPDLLKTRKQKPSCDGKCEDCNSCPGDSGKQEDK